MIAIQKETVGEKIMITTESPTWLGLFRNPRWFVWDDVKWQEWPEKTDVTDIELIIFLNEQMKILPLSYIIK